MSKQWYEFWLKDFWWGLEPSVLVVTPCRAWHFDTVSQWEWLVFATDVNIVRIDAEERNKEQQRSEWEHTVPVSELIARALCKMSFMSRYLWS